VFEKSGIGENGIDAVYRFAFLKSYSVGHCKKNKTNKKKNNTFKFPQEIIFSELHPFFRM